MAPAAPGGQAYTPNPNRSSANAIGRKTMNIDTISQRPSTQSDDNLLATEEGGALTSWGEQLISGQKTYYNQPVIKKAHWKWEIVLYFFLGGLAGGSYLAACLADLLGSPGGMPLWCAPVATSRLPASSSALSCSLKTWDGLNGS